jgi:hypothetical protein
VLYPSTGFAEAVVFVLTVELFDCVCAFANPDESDTETATIAKSAIEKVSAILGSDIKKFDVLLLKLIKRQ